MTESANGSSQPAGPWTSSGLVPIPGGSLAYFSLGEGVPVVLLHKLGGWAAEWRRVAAAFPPGFRLIAVDLPGHGSSAMGPYADWAWPLARSADGVASVLDALNFPSASVVGCSLGGCVAIVLAALRPQRVSKIGLVSVAMGKPLTEDAARKADAEQAAWFDEQDRPLPRDLETVARIAGSARPDIAAEQNQSRAAAGRWVRLSERGVMLGDVYGTLPAVQAPALMVFGANDPLIGRFESVGRKGLRNVQSAYIPDAGRFPHEEQPEATASALAQFLR